MSKSKTMRKKKTIGGRMMTLLMGGMLFITAMGVKGDVLAANIYDKSWEFVLSSSDANYKYIEKRDKLDYSKHYIYWSSTQTGGSLSEIAITPCGANWSDTAVYPAGTASGGAKHYYISNTGKYSVTNYVKELGYSCASPGIRSMKGSGVARGVWSPDSVGTYTVLQ